jgi:hypothetical protein
MTIHSTARRSTDVRPGWGMRSGSEMRGIAGNYSF